MEIFGNGGDWWHNAAGLYARGQQPEIGSVMAFPPSGNMRLGHVAVVERIVSAREVLIHHSNWAGPGIRRGTVMRGVSVVDVSPDNDWTEVRVQIGRSSESYGRVYPVYGFIHNRPDPTGGTMLAGTSTRRGVRMVREGRHMPASETQAVELAEASSAEEMAPHAAQHLNLSLATLALEGR